VRILRLAWMVFGPCPYIVGIQNMAVCIFLWRVVILTSVLGILIKAKKTGESKHFF
jgi:hypothetical protein